MNENGWRRAGMMNRRDLLRRVSMAASALALGNLPARAQRRACSPPVLGAQLFTVRNALAGNLEGTLAALSAIGVTEVEPVGVGGSTTLYGLPPAEVAAAFARHGLRAPLAHVGGDVESGAGAAAEAAHAIGIETLVMGVAPDFTTTRDGGFGMVPAESLGQLNRLAERLNAIGRELRSLGLGFGYHNHHVELIPVDGETPLDYLMSRTDPELVRLELDVAWVSVAGADPVEYLERYADRVVACHMKDFAGAGGADLDDFSQLVAGLVEPGAGRVDFTGVVEAMARLEIRHAFIEIDAAPDPLAAIERGYEHLSALSVC